MTMTNTAPASPAHDDSRAKRNVAVLVAAQAILGAQMPLIFTVGGLAGLMIAPSPALATIPISLIVFGSMTTAPWLSALMQRYGRRLGFVVGAMGGAAGAGVSAWGLWIDSFALFLIGSYLTGIYMSRKASTALPRPIPRPRHSGPRRFPTSWRAGFCRRSWGRSW